MTDNKIIEEILTAMHNSDTKRIEIVSYFNEENYDYENYINKLIKEGLAEPICEDSTILEITDIGEQVYNSGGWLKHIAKTKEESDLPNQIARLTIEKLEYEKTIRWLEEELKITGLIKNWWWLIAAAFGLGITIGKWLLS